ncbi:probable membrane-associated kinase regulator 6 [Magnolia sinica]|uniref:probable membrane-associated kinase regulator 6 n=1 Tax=Magnolia sinica TaxID=86752 RepID=UPI002659C4F3|nr:probable membrane-associated kinase regulator 6 [Magnolia sinica]
METLQQHLAIESFSYSWLINLKPSFDALDDTFVLPLDNYDDECSFIEMDPKMAHLKSATDQTQDFNFDFVAAQPLTLVHADQIFADGLLMPLHLLSTSRIQRPTSDLFSPILDPMDSPVSSVESPSLLPSSKLEPASLRRRRRLSRGILWKCLGFLRPLYRKVRWRRLGHGMTGSRTSCTESLQTTPRTSTASSTSGWCHSDERSINEAVLHCKRSIGELAL